MLIQEEISKINRRLKSIMRMRSNLNRGDLKYTNKKSNQKYVEYNRNILCFHKKLFEKC